MVKAVSIALMALLSIAAASTPVFFEAPFEPPAGRVLSGWAQLARAWELGEPAGKSEAENLAAYQKAVAPHSPAIISFRVAVDSTMVPEFLRRCREFSASYGFFVADIALDFHGKEHDVSIGMRDPELLTMGDALKDLGRPVLLRVGSNFNQPGALYDPSGYIGAFRHAVERLRFNKVKFAAVWSADAQGFGGSQHMKWYPGDDVVDWWALDALKVDDLARPATQSFVAEAARHRKPVLIDADPRGVKSEAEGVRFGSALFDLIEMNPSIKGFTLAANAHFIRWPKVAALLKQRVSEPRFIDANAAAAILHPRRGDD